MSRFDLVLISCSKTKLSEAAPAEKLYTSPLFRASADWASWHGERWAILSAKFGIIEPERVVEPYDETLRGRAADERRAWSFKCSAYLGPFIGTYWESIGFTYKGFRDDPEPPLPRIAVLAGESYLKPLRAVRSGLEFEEPLAGLQIGERLRWLNESLDQLDSEVSR